MEDRDIMLFLVTRNYDATKRFFADLGFEVPEKDDGWQVVPAFNEGRGCIIVIGALLVGLEESTHTPPSGLLYLNVGDIGVARLLSLQTKYQVKDLGSGLSGTSIFQITPPDGGQVVFTADT
jgi:hypothetical protein